MANIPMAIVLTACETVIEMVDQDEFIPTPRAGENVLQYWLRVLQYQAWERGCTHGRATPAYVDTPNPYRTEG